MQAPRTQHKKAHSAGAHSAQRKHRAGQPRADLLPSRPPREPAELAMQILYIYMVNKRSDTDLGNTQSAPRGGVESGDLCTRPSRPFRFFFI